MIAPVISIVWNTEIFAPCSHNIFGCKRNFKAYTISKHLSSLPGTITGITEELSLVDNPNDSVTVSFTKLKMFAM